MGLILLYKIVGKRVENVFLVQNLVQLKFNSGKINVMGYPKRINKKKGNVI